MAKEQNQEESIATKKISFFWERIGWLTSLVVFVVTASTYSTYLQGQTSNVKKQNKILDQVNVKLNQENTRLTKRNAAIQELLTKEKAKNVKLSNQLMILQQSSKQKTTTVIVSSPWSQFWSDTLTVPPTEQHAEGQKWGVQHQVAAMPNEVTQGLYQAIVGTNPSTTKADLLPVNNVSWHEALRFANLLSRAQGLQKCYVFESSTVVKWNDGVRCTGWRLPTEGEWRMLASAGQGTKFSGSDNFNDVAWKVDGELHEVRQKAPNAWGFFDLSGNVREYVWSDKGPVHLGGEGEVANLMDDKQQDEKLMKDGLPTVGFRLLRSLPPTSIRK